MQNREKYFLYLLLLACLVIMFFVFLPFLVPLTLGVACAVLLTPIYKALLTKTGNKPNLAAFLTVIIFVLVVVVPLVGIGLLAYQEVQNIFAGDQAQFTQLLTQSLISIQKKLSGYINIDINEQVQSIVGFISKNVGSVFSATFGTILSFVLMILSLFFFLRDGKEWRTSLIRVNPLSDSRSIYIFSEMQKSIRGIIQGYLLVALIQGFLVAIGLWIFGVPHVVLWGIVAGVAALIPAIGTMVVSIPAIIYLYVTVGFLPAFGYLLWAALLVGTVDNILNPIIVGRNVNIHPLVILLSVLGGISVFGPAGILLGPLIASLFDTLLTVYRSEQNV